MAHLSLQDQPVGPSLYLQGQRKRFYVPARIGSLLDEMSREVLRLNPENIYEFLAELCELKIHSMVKDPTGRKHSWDWRTWSSDGPSILNDEELTLFVSGFHIPIEAAEHVATVIQTAYRGFHARKDFKKLIEERQRRRSSLWEEWIKQGNFVAHGSEMQDILLHYGLSLMSANSAATKIQAMFRGHLTRKELAEHLPILTEHIYKMRISTQVPENDKYAVTIQRFYRGYHVRRELKDKAQELVDEYNNDADAAAAARLTAEKPSIIVPEIPKLDKKTEEAVKHLHAEVVPEETTSIPDQRNDLEMLFADEDKAPKHHRHSHAVPVPPITATVTAPPAAETGPALIMPFLDGGKVVSEETEEEEVEYDGEDEAEEEEDDEGDEVTEAEESEAENEEGDDLDF